MNDGIAWSAFAFNSRPVTCLNNVERVLTLQRSMIVIRNGVFEKND